MLASVPLVALAADAPVEIDQITDVGATAATGMFRFEPDYVELEPGERVAVLNSTGAHTVHSVPELWPDAVPEVAISNQPRTELMFDQPGFYGFTCARHGQYGMVMLIVVGEPRSPGGLAAALDAMRAARPAKAAFAELFQRYAEQTN